MIFITVAFAFFTLGFFTGRTGAAGTVSLSRGAETVAIAETTLFGLDAYDAADEDLAGALPPTLGSAENVPSAEPVSDETAAPDVTETLGGEASEPSEASATPPAAVESPAEVTPTGESHYLDGKLRINLATQAELESLPGIGPTIAGRIIAYRDKNGAFKRLTTLKSIEGIGDKRYAALVDLVTID